ncbi:hypothetical protein ACG7TL_002385 [Trametes sanguinea]
MRKDGAGRSGVPHSRKRRNLAAAYVHTNRRGPRQSRYGARSFGQRASGGTPYTLPSRTCAFTSTTILGSGRRESWPATEAALVGFLREGVPVLQHARQPSYSRRVDAGRCIRRRRPSRQFAFAPDSPPVEFESASSTTLHSFWGTHDSAGAPGVVHPPPSSRPSALAIMRCAGRFEVGLPRDVSSILPHEILARYCIDAMPEIFLSLAKGSLHCPNRLDASNDTLVTVPVSARGTDEVPHSPIVVSADCAFKDASPPAAHATARRSCSGPRADRPSAPPNGLADVGKRR